MTLQRRAAESSSNASSLDDGDVEALIDDRLPQTGVAGDAIYNQGEEKGKGGSSEGSAVLKVVALVAAWYLFHCINTFVIKDLLSNSERHLAPLTLVYIQLLMSAIFDGAILQTKVMPGIQWAQHDWITTARVVLPLTLVYVGSKTLGFLSYSTMPVSLAHTAKSSGPLFTVAMNYMLYNQRYNIGVYLSIVPLVIGVAMASVNQIEYNHLGFGCAILSCILGSWQSIYTKRLMTIKVDTFNLHYRNCVVGCILMLPVVIICEISYTTITNVSPVELVLSSLLQYVQSMCGYFVIQYVSALSYTVVKVLQRVFIICVSAWLYDKHITNSNLVGMVLAFLGLVGYNYFTYQSKISGKRRNEVTPLDGRGSNGTLSDEKEV